MSRKKVLINTGLIVVLLILLVLSGFYHYLAQGRCSIGENNESVFHTLFDECNRIFSFKRELSEDIKDSRGTILKKKTYIEYTNGKKTCEWITEYSEDEKMKIETYRLYDEGRVTFRCWDLYEHDQDGNLKKKIVIIHREGKFTEKYVFEYEYNGRRDLKSKIEFGFNEKQKITYESRTEYDYVYNDNGDLLKETETQYINGKLKSEEINEYEYDDNGALKCEKMFQHGKEFMVDGAITVYVHDENGNLTQYVETDYDSKGAKTGEVIVEYVYDENGEALVKTHILAQYKKEEKVMEEIFRYTYDDEWNLRTKVDSYFVEGKLKSESITKREYNEKGKPKRETIVHYDRGKKTSKFVTEYEYKDEGILRRKLITRYNKGEKSVSEITYLYDKNENKEIRTFYEDLEKRVEYIDEYSINGIILKERNIHYGKGEKYLEYITEYEYDKNGNLIKKVYSSCKKRGIKTIQEITEYDYYTGGESGNAGVESILVLFGMLSLGILKKRKRGK